MRIKVQSGFLSHNFNYFKLYLFIEFDMNVQQQLANVTTELNETKLEIQKVDSERDILKNDIANLFKSGSNKFKKKV